MIGEGPWAMGERVSSMGHHKGWGVSQSKWEADAESSHAAEEKWGKSLLEEVVRPVSHRRCRCRLDGPGGGVLLGSWRGVCGAGFACVSHGV